MRAKMGGIAEVAKKLKVNSQSVRNWSQKPLMKFPKPLAKLSMGSVYDVDEVVQWFRRSKSRRKKSFGTRYFR